MKEMLFRSTWCNIAGVWWNSLMRILYNQASLLSLAPLRVTTSVKATQCLPATAPNSCSLLSEFKFTSLTFFFSFLFNISNGSYNILYFKKHVFMTAPTRRWHGKGTFMEVSSSPLEIHLTPPAPTHHADSWSTHAQLPPIRPLINAPVSGWMSTFCKVWRRVYSQITNAHSLSAVLPLFQQNHYL